MTQITINDWAKFNPRTDSKNHTWFRFENTFFIKTFSWTAEQQRLFQYLCCVCSQEKKTTFDLDMQLAVTFLRRKEQQITADLRFLQEKGVVTISNLKLLEVTQSQLVPTNERTNERTNVVFDFERIYEEYPRKEGKTEGLKKCLSQITNQKDFDLLLKSVRKYSKTCKEERKEKKFIKMFSSFMSVWRDYSSDDPIPPINPNRAPSGLPPVSPEPERKITPEEMAELKKKLLWNKSFDGGAA